MKVSLWAEIRRLYEVEGLKRREIARRLHCCTKTVAKALALLTPPLPPPISGENEGIIAPYRAQIDALVARYPNLSAVRVLEEISGRPGRMHFILLGHFPPTISSFSNRRCGDPLPKQFLSTITRRKPECQT